MKKIYLTEMEVLNEDYASGFAKVAGPRVEATSQDEAEMIILNSSYRSPLIKVVGQLVSEY